MPSERNDIDASTDAWFRWLETVEEGEREELGAILGAADLTTREGLVGLYQAIMVAAIQGKLSPDMVKVLRDLGQDQMTLLLQIHAKTPELLGGSLQRLSGEVIQTVKLRGPVYTGGDQPPGLPDHKFMEEIEKAGK